MADKKVSQLTSLTSPASEDILLVIDNPAGTPTSKQITVKNLLGSAPSNTSITGTLTVSANTTLNGSNTVISSNKIGKVTFLDSNIESIDNKKIFKSKILFEISNQKKFYQKLQIPKNSRIKLFNIYFELEKDLNIDGIKINKLIFNKETKNTSLFKSKDLTDLVDINEMNNLKNWIEVKKFITQMFSKINTAN